MLDIVCFFFFLQAEDCIRDAQESRGLGDVYKRQEHTYTKIVNGSYDARLRNNRMRGMEAEQAVTVTDDL